MDFDALESSVTSSTRVFILCNPHNPSGRTFTAGELSQLGSFCLEHGLVICSDEIHSDLLLADSSHVPLASLDEEIAKNTITLLAPSKTFNLPGLGCSMLVIPNPGLRARVKAAARGIIPHVNTLGMYAALAAYSHCDGWLRELCSYLTDNRTFLLRYVDESLNGVVVTEPQATYLAWLDCRSAIEEDPYEFFLNRAKVALSWGKTFGPGGEGFVRLNFGCPRSTLQEALARMSKALE
jgi:cystathionine beta-lyase